ncbi:hypothetical protein [Zavarzinia aquatilis]|nr:hypothetical protein [Zavarzinia aquatilis]
MRVSAQTTIPEQRPQQIAPTTERVGERENDGDSDDGGHVAAAAPAKSGYLSPGVGASVDISA